MANRLETGELGAGIGGEAKFFLNPRQKLEGFLPGLRRQDRLFVEAIVSDPNVSPKLSKDIVSLLEMDAEGRKSKQEERLAAEQVNMMDIIEPFNEKERIIIARNLPQIEMTLGCTGGCPWCAADAPRHVTKAFTFDSFKEFMGKYGKYLPRQPYSALYEATDPFDWMSPDGKFSYTDLVEVFRESTGNKLFTSTSLPVGTELSFIRFMLTYWTALRGKDSFEEMKKVNYLSGIRMSQKQDSKERIGKTFEIMQDIGIPKKFIKAAIEIADRENPESSYKFLNVGRFINNPKRSEANGDLFGIYYDDFLRLTHSGIYAGSMETVTVLNDRGLRDIKLTPGLLKIPVSVSAGRYIHPNDDRHFHTLFPKIRYKVYENGDYKGIEKVESAGRDILAFDCLLNHLEVISDWCRSEKGRAFFTKRSHRRMAPQDEIRKFLIPKYKERRASCISNFSTETNKEAVGIAQRYIAEADGWVENLNEKLGLSKSGELL